MNNLDLNKVIKELKASVGYILCLKTHDGDLQIRSDGMPIEEALASVAEVGNRILADMAERMDS